MTFQLDQIRTWPWSGSLTLVTLMTQLLIRIAIYVYNLNVSGHFFLWNRTYKIISEIDVFPPKNCCIFNYIRRSIMKDMILWLEHPKSTFPKETSSYKINVQIRHSSLTSVTLTFNLRSWIIYFWKEHQYIDITWKFQSNPFIQTEVIKWFLISWFSPKK